MNADPKKGFGMASQAASSGRYGAQYMLGVCYEQGIGCEKNLDDAAGWYESSSGFGYLPATYNLGVMLYNGYPDGSRREEGKELIRKAAAQGFQPAAETLKQIQ